MMYYDGDTGHWGWMLVSMGFTLLFWAGLVWSIARLIINGNRRDARQAMPQETDALAILQRRYASGELDETEYEHRRQVLLGSA